MKIICNDVVLFECEFLEEAMEWMFLNNGMYAIVGVDNEKGVFYVAEIFGRN